MVLSANVKKLLFYWTHKLTIRRWQPKYLA